MENKAWLLLLAGLLIVQGDRVEAGGILLYETGTPEVGLAGAGWAARAQDAATILTNPAGMTRLEGGELMVGAQLLYGSISFTPGAETSQSGGDGGNPVGLFPGASTYYSHSLSDRLKVGFGLYGNFGLALEYEDTWVGRYHFQNGALIGLTLAPTVAWKLTDSLSIGAGLNMMYGYFSTEAAVNNPLPGLADGRLKVDDTQWGYGANLGLLWELDGRTRFGLQYTSEIVLDFKDTVTLTGLGPGLTAALGARGLLDTQLALEMVVPQTAMFSFFRQLNDTWALMGNLGWQDWSRYGRVGVTVRSEDTRSLAVERDYDDSYHAALGAQYDLAGPWSLSFGVAYDTGIVDETTISPDLPNGDTWRFSLGSTCEVSTSLTVNLGYTFLWMGDLDMRLDGGPLNGDLVGTYEDAAIHFFAANFRWRF